MKRNNNELIKKKFKEIYGENWLEHYNDYLLDSFDWCDDDEEERRNENDAYYNSIFDSESDFESWAESAF